MTELLPEGSSTPSGETEGEYASYLELLDQEQPAWLQAQVDREKPPAVADLSQIQDRLAQNAVARMWQESQAQQAKFAAEQLRLEQDRKALDDRFTQLATESADAMSFVRDPKLMAMLRTMAEEPAPDEDSPQFAAYIGRQAAVDALTKVFATMASAHQQAIQVQEQRRQEAEAAAERQRNTDYINANLQDFQDPAVVERIKVLVHRHQFSIPDAHKVSMQERAALQFKDEQELREKARETARARIRRGGVSEKMPTEPPKGLSIVERDEWYQAHPEARAARLRRLQSR